MAIYLTSDLHLSHNREFVWKVRGYNSVDEMNKEQVRKWNETINPEDDVYVLGDLVLGNTDEGIEYLKQLNGKIHIVYGNHDTDARKQRYNELDNVVEACYATMIHYKKYHFYLSHYPTMTGNLENEHLKQMTLNLFGHTHQTTNFYEDRPYMFHVGVDSHDGYPVLLDDIIEEMKAKVQECKQYLGEATQDAALSAAAPILAPATPVEPLARPGTALTTSEVISNLAMTAGNAGTANKQCDKCVFQYWSCEVYPPPSTGCQYFKREPPDGGYYG